MTVAASLLPIAAHSSTLGIDERPDRWVVQRHHAADSWVGDLALGGTVDSSAGAVEARVIASVGGAEIAPWTVVDGAPTGGVWTGMLTDIPEGGWYRIEARLVDQPAVSAQASGRFGVGLVVATIGQSNNVKMFTEDEGDGSVPPPFAIPGPLTRRYGYGEPMGFDYARPRTVDIPVSWGEVTGSGGIRLANGLTSHLGVPVLLLDFALDWTGLDDHWNNDLHRSWQRFAEALDLVGEIGAVVWHQGAYEAHETEPTVASYKAGLDLLQQRISDRAGTAGIPLVVAIQNRGVYDQDLDKDTYYNRVRQAQLEWIGERPYGFAAGTTIDLDLSSRPGTGNGHFWAAGYQEVADRYLRGVLQAISHPGFEAGVEGGRIASASWRGGKVVVEVAHDHGARLRLPNPNSNIEGFTLTDGDWVLDQGSGPERNHLLVQSAVLSDDLAGNWIELELAEPPSGSVKLRYLFGQNPFFAKATDEQRRRNGNTLFDDFAYHPQRSGLPINGTTVDIDVTQAIAIQADVSQLSVPEGGSASVAVSLLDPPPGPVTVSIEALGDGDLEPAVTSLLFDPADWAVAQQLEITAAADVDSADGTALLRLRAAGHHGALVRLIERDTDPHLDVTPSSLSIARSGGRGELQVALGALPGGPVAVEVTSSTAPSVSVTPSTLLFDDSDWHLPQTVTVTGVVDSEAGESTSSNVILSIDDAASTSSYDGLPDLEVPVDLIGLDDALLLHWSLDESAGQVAADISGHGHHGIIGAHVGLGVEGVRDGACLTAGPGGGAGSLEDAISGPSVQDQVLNQLTVAFWYRLPAGAGAGYLFTWGGSYNRANTVSVYMDPGDELRLRVHDSGDTTSLESLSPPGFDDDRWHHVAIIKDATGSRLWLDGSLRSTSTAGAGPIAPPRGVTLGTNELGTYGLAAEFDDLRLYDRALGGGEVAALASLGDASLAVELAPAGAVAAGARWRLATEAIWRTSGEVVAVPAGAYEVIFDDLTGWQTPPPRAVDLEAGDAVTLGGTYVADGHGTLVVELEPAQAVAAGARWRLVGDSLWRHSGEALAVPVGSHDLAFETVPGWLPPAGRPVTVAEAATRVITATYVDAATLEPIALLPFDETAGNVALDATGHGHDATFAGAVDLAVDGVLATGIDVDAPGGAGSHDGVRVDSLSGDSYDRLSVDFWYRLPAAAHDGYLLTWGGSYNDANHLSIYLDVDQGLRVRVRDGEDNTSLESVAPAGFADSAWHHLALTKGTAGTTIFFDGQPLLQSPMGDGTLQPTVGLRLGANENGQWGAGASFDHLRLWARQLPAAEIEQIYANNARASLAVDLLPAAVSPLASWRLTSGPDLAWHASGDRISALPAGVYTIEYQAVAGWTTPAPDPVVLSVGSDLSLTAAYSAPDGLLWRWPLDETTGSTAFDSSGYGHHASLGSGVLKGLSGVDSLAASTVGPGGSIGTTGDSITGSHIPDAAYPEVSVAFWYRLEAAHDGYLFSWGGSYNDANQLSAYLDVDGGLRLRAHDDDDHTSVLAVTPAGWADGGWHHLVLVTDAAGTRAYFDGALAGTSSMGAGAIQPAGFFRLGANEHGTYGLGASFDELTVHLRALDDTEVAELYTANALGQLTVAIEPARAAADGGRWRLLSGPDTSWHASAEKVALPPGIHTVEFDTVAGWRAPEPVQVTVQVGASQTLAGTYLDLEQGELSVDLLPASAAALGAQWRLPDAADPSWHDSGETVSLLSGSYSLEASPVAGYETPQPLQVEVVGDQLTLRSLTYVLARGPMLDWSLDDPDPGFDASGFSRHGTVGERLARGLVGVAGEAVQTTGPGGPAGSAADVLHTADFAPDDAYDELTIALWYRLPAEAHDGYLFSWGGSNNDANHLSAFLDSGRELRVRVHDAADTGSIVAVAPPSFDDTAWHHLAVVKDAAGSRVYFDGSLVASSSAGGGEIRPQRGFVLGSNPNYQFGIEATFDQLGVWDRAFVDSEVSDLASITAPTGFGGAYRTADEIYLAMQQVISDHGAIAEWVDYGDSWAKADGGHTTPGGDFLPGDDLVAVRVSNRSITGSKPVMILMACLHAREIATPELALRFLEWLTDGYGVDADATWLVDHHELWILPLTNPDGHRMVELGARPENGARPWSWRKNVHPDGACAWPPTGPATEGVDLNRNFPFEWGTSGGRAGSATRCSAYFRGTAAASEPETTGIMSLVRSLIADQRGPGTGDAAPASTTGLFLQLHSPYRTVSWPWAHSSSPPPNAADLQAIGDKMAAIAGYSSGQVHDEVYEMTGTADDWVYGELGAAALLLEVGEGLMPPYHRIDNMLWPETRDAFVYAAKIARTPYLTGHGPEVDGLLATSEVGGVTLDGVADDLDTGGLALAAAEAYIGQPPWDPSAVAVPLDAADGTFDSATEAISGFIDTSGLDAGQHLVWVRAEDAAGHWGAVSAIFVDVP